MQIPALLVLAVLAMSLAAEPVNYDTAWTFLYDGGTLQSGGPVPDKFYDAKVLPNGESYCVGLTNDSTTWKYILLIKLDSNGKVLWKKNYARGGSGHSIVVARNGDLIIGGERGLAPFIIRVDTSGNIKWSIWYYDSLHNSNLLQRSATINCLRENARGSIVCAAGDVYPDNNGLTMNNYAAFMEFDSLGKYKRGREWNNIAGYTIAGFDIEESEGGEYLFSGGNAVFYLDTTGKPGWQTAYSYQLSGVGSEIANINRAKVLRGNIPMVAGQVYEGNCWTKYKQLYYDAWWSPINYSDGSNTTWDTAGAQGGNDALYDFTQLSNGNLVLVGCKATQNSGVWTIVTDSTGKNVLWEKTSILPGKDAGGFSLTTLLPLSVCGTPDSGFTVVGDNNTFGNNHNAFAMHFALASTATIPRHSVILRSNTAVKCTINGSKAVFSFTSPITSESELTIYNAAGKRIARLSHAGMPAKNNTLSWDFSGTGKGVYIYRLTNSGAYGAGEIIVNGD